MGVSCVIKLTIPGRPVPKARPRLGVHGRKAYEDDDQVVELVVRKHKVKRKEEERVEIEIKEAV